MKYEKVKVIFNLVIKLVIINIVDSIKKIYFMR